MELEFNGSHIVNASLCTLMTSRPQAIPIANMKMAASVHHGRRAT